VGTRTAAERIEAITVQGRKLYRMHYGPPVGALQGSKGYVDLDPERSFLATGGREEMQSWEIEYGDAADGIPVMKSYRHISRTGRHDHLVDTPTHWVTVEGAELANSIDDREFELTFYGVERPERDPRYYDPTEPVELPRPFLYALVGTGGFLVLVLSAHFLQARRRRARSAHSSSAPAGGPAVHAS
jgi:hypothetical protein